MTTVMKFPWKNFFSLWNSDELAKLHPNKEQNKRAKAENHSWSKIKIQNDVLLSF